MIWEGWGINIGTLVTAIGTIVTILGTIVTIKNARRTETYRKQTKRDIRKINLAGVVDQIRRAQDDIRKLPTTFENVPRGLKVKELIQEIRAKFDNAIGVIASEGPDKDIRGILTAAQQVLNSYEVSFNGDETEAHKVYKLQELMQDAVSATNSRIFSLEDKA